LLIYGIEQSAYVAAICTVLETIGLVVVIGVGIPNLGATNYLEFSSSGGSGVLAAGALVFFAYIGFEEIAQLAEETHDATRNIPLAVLLSIAITTVLYVLVAIAAVSVIGWERLGSSESPLADVAAVALGQHAFVGLSIIALFSTGNTVLVLIMSAARLLYGMAEDGTMPSRLAAIHQTRQSPYAATIAIACASILIIAGLRKIAIVANVTNFALLAAFLIINATVVALRYREPNTHRPFRIPLSLGRLPLIPVCGVVSSLFLLSYVGIDAILIGLGVGLTGLIVYWIPTGRVEKT
jgi:APA family basic amino acid/polyamine antiporter